MGSVLWVPQPEDPRRPGYRCWHFQSINAIQGAAWYAASCELEPVMGLRQTLVTVTVVRVWWDQRTGRQDGKLVEQLSEPFLLEGWAETWATEKRDLIAAVFYYENEEDIEAYLRAGGINGG